MPGIETRALRAVRSTSFNNEAIAELLQEITPFVIDPELRRRLRCAIRQLARDADSLESAWQALAPTGRRLVAGL